MQIIVVKKIYWAYAETVEVCIIGLGVLMDKLFLKDETLLTQTVEDRIIGLGVLMDKLFLKYETLFTQTLHTLTDVPYQRSL